MIVASIICFALGIFFLDRMFKNSNLKDTPKGEANITGEEPLITPEDIERKHKSNSDKQSTPSSQASGIDPLVSMYLANEAINGVLDSADNNSIEHEHHHTHEDCNSNEISYSHHNQYDNSSPTSDIPSVSTDYSDSSSSDSGSYDGGCDCGGCDCGGSDF